HRAAELGQQTVAGGADDAALMFLDELSDDAAVQVQRLERALLVHAHEPAIAGHIGGQNGGKTALGAFFSHATRCPGKAMHRILLAACCGVYRADFRSGSKAPIEARSLLSRSAA